jgi:hypothetical protein
VRAERGSFAAALAVVALAAGCASARATEVREDVVADRSVDARAVDRVARLAADARAWLLRRYGPPRRLTRARLRLVSDLAALEPARARLGLEARGAGRPGDRDSSMATDEPAEVVLAPLGRREFERADALARWIFYVEWTPGLPPWLREGLAETAGAAFAAADDPTAWDATLGGLLPTWIEGQKRPFPDVAALAALDAPGAARAFADSARAIAAETDGGEPALVRELLDRPPLDDAAVASFSARVRAAARAFPTLRRVLGAIAARPLALSTTLLVQAATPPEGAFDGELCDAARARDALAGELARTARAGSPAQRKLAVYGLGRLGVRDALVAAAADPRRDVRAAAIVARARQGDAAVARELLELAKDGPLEEAAGCDAPVLELFDRLAGFVEPAAPADAELSLERPLAKSRPGYRDIERRERWLARR